MRESSELDIPLVTGLIRPTILLPSYSNEWSREELRIVLLHELAHVRRADLIARATAMIACGLNWFNPLVWMLDELSARDAELAADDLVLQTGIRPSTYADALLNIATGAFHFPYAQPAVPLARSGLLAERVEGILRDSRRKDVGSVTKWSIIICACITAVLSACVSFTPAHVGVSAETSINPGFKVTPQETVVARRPSAPVKQATAAMSNDSSWIEGAADELIRALGDPSPQVRGAAAHSLGNLHVARARTALERLRSESDKSVQYEVDRALTMISN